MNDSARQDYSIARGPQEEAATQLVREREPAGPPQPMSSIKLLDPDEAMHSDQIVVVVVSLVLLFCFFAVMALVTRFLVHKHTKQTTTTTNDDTNICMADGSTERQRQLTNISSSWKRLFTPRQEQSKGHWAPTLSGIVKAGDEGLFSSALFTTLHGHPGELPIEALYDAFATELRTRSMTERSAYSTELSKFLAGTKRGSSGLGRAKSVSYRAPSNGRVDLSPKAQRKSLDLSVTERGLPRSISMKRPAPALVSISNGLLKEEGKQKPVQGSWMKDGQAVDHVDGKMSVKITPAELAALSLILGSPLNSGTEGDNVSLKKGAYGISISTTTKTENGKRQIHLRQHKRSTFQQHARGSGVSPLFAKHLAAGSLPYSQDKSAVNSILITNETLDAIRAGASLYTHSSAARTPESRFLTALPRSRALNFHILAASTEQHSSATLIDAIAALPFVGGLAPLASAPLIRTVQFMAAGGLSPARLLQRIEGLVDKVHRQSPHLNIFGPLYEPHNAGLLFRERERLGKLATNANQSDLLSEKTARMSRYITLLERLMALVPDMKAQDVLNAVREATKAELNRSYIDAVAAYSNTSATPSIVDSRCPESDARSKRQSTVSRASARRSNRSSTVSMLTVNSFASPASSDTFPAQNLGKQLEQVLKMELPLSIETIAFVTRMVLVAWTLSVDVVAWEKDEAGFEVPSVEASGEKMIIC